MLKIFHPLSEPIPQPIRAIALGLVGYGFTFYFVFAGLLMPKTGHPAHVLATLISAFEVLPFIYLAYLGPGMIGMGWALIVVLAFYQKRIFVIGILLSLAGYSYWETSKEVGHPVKLAEITSGFPYFFGEPTGAFLICIVPLCVLLGLIVVLMLRAKNLPQKP